MRRTQTKPAKAQAAARAQAASVTPRGYIRIAPEGVSYESIDDQKVIPLAGIFMVAWSVFWIAATIRYIAKQVAKTRQARIKAG